MIEGPTGRLPRGRRPAFLRLNNERVIIGVDTCSTATTGRQAFILRSVCFIPSWTFGARTRGRGCQSLRARHARSSDDLSKFSARQICFQSQILRYPNRQNRR